MFRTGRSLGAAMALGFIACTNAPSTLDAQGTDASSDDAMSVTSDPDPVFTDENRVALHAMHYDLRDPPTDPSNRFADDPAARVLGQRFFFDTSFSGSLLEGDNDGGAQTLGQRGQGQRVSCAGCHIPSSGFVDTRSPHRQISLAAQWTHRRTPTLLEAAWAPLYNWDGRRDSIWNQALGVIESDREFNGSRLFVAQQIFRLYHTDYEAVFGALPPLDDASRFPPISLSDAGCQLIEGAVTHCHGKPGDGAEYDHLAPDDQVAVTRVAVNVAKAIEAYVRELRCGTGRFDAWLDGDQSAMSRAEQRGAALFVGRARCATCHNGPRLTDGAFHNVGLLPVIVAVAFTDSGDRGAASGITDALADPLNTRGIYSDGDRGALPTSVSPALEGSFRTPTLRCVRGRPSFMHTGQIMTVDRVVGFFDRGGDNVGYPGTNELSPLGLTALERSDLTAFLSALDGAGPSDSLQHAP